MSDPTPVTGEAACGMDLDAIERAARAADVGPWKLSRSDRGVCYVLGPSSNPSIPSPDVVASTRFSDRLMPNDNANMAFIATLDPPTALALVARVRSAEARVAELEARGAELVEALKSSAVIERMGWTEEEPPRFTATLVFADGAPQNLTFATVWQQHRVVIVDCASAARLVSTAPTPRTISVPHPASVGTSTDGRITLEYEATDEAKEMARRVAAAIMEAGDE